ncbi:MAG: hypothetical protein ACPGJE_03795 [Wenzhouxiangellaceae bacterium]
MGAIRIIFGWAIAVIVVVILGSVIQTQFNLAFIASMGPEISLGQRLATTWHDLLNFTPAWAMLMASAFAIAWPVAWLVKRALPGHRPLVFALAGFSAVWATIAIMNRALPVTAIGATRDLSGTLALAAAGLVAGWVYARLVRMDHVGSD